MENPSPVSVHSHAQRDISDTAEDRTHHETIDEYSSDEDGDEEGPKRKRARPLSASCLSFRNCRALCLDPVSVREYIDV